MLSKLPSTHERQRPDYFPPWGEGGRDATVVRVQASHLCGLGLIPGLIFKFGQNLLLVLVLGSSVFRSPRKTNVAKFQIDLERTDTFEASS